MFITEDESEIPTVFKYIQGKHPDMKVENYVLDPKVAEKIGYESTPKGSLYESVHGNNKEISLEIQMKTKGMYYAQVATHESIYKNDKLSKGTKEQLSAVLSPIIKIVTDIEREKEMGLFGFEKIEQLEKARDDLLEENAKLLGDNKDVVKETWKEYAKVEYSFTNYKRMEPFFAQKMKDNKNLAEKKKVRIEDENRKKHFDKVISEIYDYYYDMSEGIGLEENSKIGDARSDFAIKKVEELDYDYFEYILTESYQEKDSEEKTPLYDRIDDLLRIDNQEGKSIAREVISKTIGVNDSLDDDVKEKLSSVLSQMIELQCDAENKVKTGNVERAHNVIDNKENCRFENMAFLSDHAEVVNEAWREYAKTKYRFKNSKEFEKLNPTQHEKMDEVLDDIIDYYSRNQVAGDAPSLSNDMGLDSAIKKLQGIEYKKVKQIFNTKNKEKNITARDIVRKVLEEEVEERDLIESGKKLEDEYKGVQGQLIFNIQGDKIGIQDDKIGKKEDDDQEIA